jgi:hypothetical protein
MSPDRRRHRGVHPGDERLFGASSLPALRAAVADLSWLLSRSYAEKSALKLAGDRYQLDARQRLAVLRSACSDRDLEERRRKEEPLGKAPQASLAVDGYNLLITLESALSGGFLFQGRDGCCRDLASLHGTYRTVEETLPALHLVGEVLAARHVGAVTWFLDAPVSNSGRLASLIRTVAAERGWPWSARLEPSPDPLLASSAEVVATSDSWILDRCRRWTNLAREVIAEKIPAARVMRL